MLGDSRISCELIGGMLAICRQAAIVAFQHIFRTQDAPIAHINLTLGQ
jgi:hypothetical protein